ncbi:tripartite tricarboxylate transporter TctB family protein [Chelativorans xinjiangense]|uniref:tripartite tricarboxylate transporter TctB family protein n=1 Tax=Chelativorans xinjiangense TaxID=2681485 RepID=UPI00135C96AC|nr:tripartite tricarboxylate transporter TctB family protein [Chelativorans xinjiangense]
MSFTVRQANWLTVAVLLVIVGIVFQQIATDMVEQGIASGSPYDNAAAYPKAVAILLGGMALLQSILMFIRRAPDEPPASAKQLRRPALLVLIFAVYLALLGWLGYHLTTVPMLAAVMLLCGMRRPMRILPQAIVISFGLAYFFEAYLKIVLPGGVFQLNIPW